MDTTPQQLKKGNILLFMTPKQRLSFALTNKSQMKWIRPILRFMDLPVNEKIVSINSPSRSHLTDDLIVEAFSKEMDHSVLNLLTSLSNQEKNQSLKQKLHHLLEKRLMDRNYKKLIKKTLLKNYIQYLLREGKSVARFLNRIDSPEIRSQAIEQYLLLTRNDLTPGTRKKWIERIPDQLTRQKTKRMF